MGRSALATRPAPAHLLDQEVGSMRTGWQEIELNGVPQWVSMRGDPDAPFLLFLHGGPGGAEFGPRRHYLRALESSWRVVDWEQRGAGRSFRGDETAATLSLEILVEDGLALLGRLLEEGDGRPPVVVGHSFGTVLGVLMAARAPERIGAYVGASQVVDWGLQEERSYDWALAEARRVGHAKAMAALEEIGRPVDGVYRRGTASVEVQRRWLGSLGGVSGDPGFLMRWMATILAAGDYPIRTKLRFSKGMTRSMELIWPELGETVVFSRDVNRLDMPVHVFAGDVDRITGLDQVRPWLERLDAPVKRLEVVEGAGHLCLYEAPERFISFVNGVAAGTAVPAPAVLGVAAR
jgi:pimeloyl-ACP methyl ester carboxylesterase